MHPLPPPPQVVLHGVKYPHQFQALHNLFQEPSMRRCHGHHGPSAVHAGSSGLESSDRAAEPAWSFEPAWPFEAGVQRFSAAQQPPVAAVEGYAHTPHGQLHAAQLLARLPSALRCALRPPSAAPGLSGGHGYSHDDGGNDGGDAALPVLGASPWDDWPVFGPADCNAASGKVETAWDKHVSTLGLPGAYSQAHLPESASPL